MYAKEDDLEMCILCAWGGGSACEFVMCSAVPCYTGDLCL